MRIAELLAARNADPFQHRPVTIACLGDSVTHGCFEVFKSIRTELDTRYAPGEGYVRRLQDRLFLLYPTAAATVINCGVGGDSAPGACARFARDVARFAPDLVVVDLGLNDASAADPEQALRNYVQAMRGIFEQTAALGAEGILLTPNRMCAYVDPSLPDGIAREFAEHVTRVQNEGVLARFVASARELAADMGVPVADAYAEWERLQAAGVDTTALLANRINHPIPEMHEIFVDVLLRTMLAQF